MSRVILETPRLQLREFNEGDVAAFYILCSDPAIMRYVGGAAVALNSIEQARESLLARPISDYRKYGYGRWACVDKATGEVIGFAGLKYLDDLAEVDLGYRFLPSYWGKGLATESGKAVLDFGFSQLKLPRIIGLVDPENVASVRVLEKLGLKYSGLIDYFGDKAGKYVIEGRTTKGT